MFVYLKYADAYFFGNTNDYFQNPEDLDLEALMKDVDVAEIREANMQVAQARMILLKRGESMNSGMELNFVFRCAGAICGLSLLQIQLSWRRVGGECEQIRNIMRVEMI